MRSLFDLSPELQLAPIEPFNGPSRDRRAGAHANAGADLYALGGAAAILKAAGDEDDAWDPHADEETGAFDIHLGVYTSD